VDGPEWFFEFFIFNKFCILQQILDEENMPVWLSKMILMPAFVYRMLSLAKRHSGSSVFFLWQNFVKNILKKSKYSVAKSLLLEKNWPNVATFTYITKG